ncbi:OmpL47-type beta-barrel domain-containing protein [Bacillus ndiopicus]|uniref:OmpL47-type beta-barrel domain-containing protein n=1 Tax=Bacillus ndiopicus TaxID=1347368 RepID=UPI0005A9CB0D|nr:Ig-like domain repeat protein [Bacillus ndiopicus]
MSKRLSSKISALLALVLVLQIFLLPMKNVLGATDNSILPPSNLAYQHITPDVVKLTWSEVVSATGYKIYEITEGQLIPRGTVTTNSYTINDLPEGSYTYVVSTLSANGESGPCAPITVDIVYPTIEAPTLTYTLQNVNDINLSWTTSLYAEGYKVYQIGSNGESTLVTTVTGKTYTISNAPEGDFKYAVSSFSSKFGESPISNTVSVTLDHPEMAAPTNLMYTITNVNDVTLKWTAAANATGYNVYQIIGDQKILKSTVTGTSVTYTNMPSGEYVYEVHSVSSRFGESAGNQVTVTIGEVTLLPPSNVTFTIANLNDVTLKWNAAANATSYKIYQIIDDQKILKSTVTGTSVTYTNTPSGEYVYEIHSVSSRFGESAEGSQVNVIIGEVAMTPPSNVTYTIVNGNDIVLKWDAATNATSYKVYQIIDGQKVLKSTVTKASVTFANSSAGDYAYEIYSVSSRFGESANGSPIPVTVEPVEMAAPANPIYTAANINDVTLSWDTVTYATNYKVYQVLNGQKVLKSTVTTPKATFTNLPAGDYTYEIHAFSSRFGESAESAKISFAIEFPQMNPPANLTYVIKNTSDFTLNWDAVKNATSYKVYQIIDGQKILKNTVTSTTINYTKMSPGEYTYEIHSVSNRFGESVEGSIVSLKLNDVDLPSPTNLVYTVLNGNDIKLTWTAVTGASSYKVYEIIDGQRVLKSTITGTTVTYTNQSEGDHSYVVTTFSSLLGESSTAAEITVPLQNPNMAAPSSLTFKIQNGNDVVLTWGAVQYATSYKVYEIIDGQKVLKNTVTTLSAKLSNVSFGDHVYVVHSVSSRFGESAEGSEVSVNMSEVQMAAPDNATYSFVNGNDIKLTWGTVPYGTNYKVYQIIDGQKVLKSTLTTTTVTYANQPQGEYVFEIHSYNSRYGESSEGSKVSLTLVFPEIQAPSNLTKTATNVNDIVLKWNAVTYATSYKVYQIVDGQKVLKNTVTTTSASFPKMEEGQYEFVVHAVSPRFGESAEGSNINFDIIWPEVQAPEMTSTIFNGNNITLSWQAVNWANEYLVYEVTESNRQLVYKGTALTTQLYNLSEATHSYEIVAYSTRFGESAPSSLLAVNIVYPEMESPVASIKLLSPTSARILWNFVTYANGYNLYEIVNGEPVLIAEKINNLSYTISDLTYADHEYYVTAYSNSFGESTPSNIVLAKLIVDTTAPVTTANVPAGWTNVSPVEVTLSATDDETGVANMYYSLDGDAFVSGTSFTVSEQGIHKITFYSIDKVGNKEAEKTAIVKIDTEAPATKTSDIPEWLTANKAINLLATDALSGVYKTFYSIDGAAYVEGTTIKVDGSKASYNVNFYSVDVAGNKEEVQTIKLKADLIAPTTTATAPAKWTNKDAVVKLQAQDVESGVAKTFYSIDGSSFVEGNTFTVQQEGKHTIQFYSVDLAGNVEDLNTIEVKIDKTVPNVSMDVSKEYKLGDSVQLTYLANDSLSGVVSEKMVVTSPSLKTTVVANGDSIKFDEQGMYNVTITATDAAGNSTTITKQFAVYIPATIEVTPEVIKGNKGVFTVRVILPAGISTKGFDLNTATINGVKALNSNNGYYNQAGLGQFKFERSDFTWNQSQVTLVFKGYVNGVLVVGQKTVKVIQ